MGETSHRLVPLDTANPVRVLPRGRRRIVLMQAQVAGVRFAWGSSEDAKVGFTIGVGGRESYGGGDVPNAELWAMAEAAGAKLAVFAEASTAPDVSRLLDALGTDRLLVADVSGVRALEK